MNGKNAKPRLFLLLALLCGAPLMVLAQRAEPADPDLVTAYRRLRFERQYPPEMAAYVQSQLQDVDRASKKLAELAKDERGDVRALVAMLLGELGQPEGAATLWVLTRDDADYVSMTAAGSLVRLAQLTPVAISTEGLKDERPAVQRSDRKSVV